MPKLDRTSSSRFSVVKAEQSAEPFTTSDRARPSHVLEIPIDQRIPQPLMIPLVMVVSHVLRDGPSQVLRDAVRAGFAPVYPPTGRFVVLSRKAREPASELPVR